MEAENFYHGLPSKPRLVARSSTHPWTEQRGLIHGKEATPLGFHPLQEKWETTIGPEITSYLDAKGVACSSIDPVRMGEVGDPSPPPIIWIGVLPGSLLPEIGIEVALDCRSILSRHGIDDIHIEIRESKVFFSGAKLFKPAAPSAAITASLLEPFSTALGIPISAEDTPTFGGTGGFFVFDEIYPDPDAIFLVTARHVVIRPHSEDNKLYKRSSSGQPCRNVLLCSDSAIVKYTTAVESAIGTNKDIVKDNQNLLEAAERREQMGGEARVDRDRVKANLMKARKAVEDLETLHSKISGNWQDQRDRILGSIVLSPPITAKVGDAGFTEDWAIIQIDKEQIDETNFVGNAIDLGTNISVEDFEGLMRPDKSESIPPSFKYPGNRLLMFSGGTIPDNEMWKPTRQSLDQDNDPVIMVIKNGYASGVTVGRLNTIRSTVRSYFSDGPGLERWSNEVTVLSRNSKSGAFSQPGDSGSAVIDGKGRLAGLLTGGSGATPLSDCTYVTSINFLRERMLLHGIKINLVPSFAN